MDASAGASRRERAFSLCRQRCCQQNLRREAVARGIAAERIVFGGRLPAPEYRARYRVADLFLDMHPYNAGTTASDALWAGLPVLTCAGDAFASRVTASLLNAIGLPELVTHSRHEYETLAVSLARDAHRLGEICGRLDDNRTTAPLFDSSRFTTHIEAAYAAMHERQRAGLAPGDIRVPVSASVHPDWPRR
jgi:protein O-GlcNAc transferase